MTCTFSSENMDSEHVQLLHTVPLSDLNTPHKLSQWLSDLGRGESTCDAVASFMYENQMVGSTFRQFNETDFKMMLSSMDPDPHSAMESHSWAWECLKEAQHVDKETHGQRLQWVGGSWTTFQVLHGNEAKPPIHNTNSTVCPALDGFCECFGCFECPATT